MTLRPPFTLQLPSGRRARVLAAAPRAARTLAESFAALDGAVDVDGGLASLPLADANVLRVALVQAGLVDEPAVRTLCQNCDHPFDVRPSAAVELGPYLDGELGDEELDELDHDADDPIPEVALPSGVASTARLRVVTVAEVAPLHAALAKPELEVTEDVARALGVVALGDELDTSVIARALDAAPDAALDEVAELFTEAAYPERLTALVLCPSCGARTPVDAPALREFPAHVEPLAALPLAAGYPDDEAFEARARERFRAATRERGIYGVQLIVEHGVPDCDDGGNPLLGSYEPEIPEEDGQPGVPPTVRVFSREFRRAFGDEPDVVFDEIDETIDHELDHHQAFLSGEDPEHEREQALLVEDERRRVGATESLRRASARARSEVWDLVARMWPFALIALAVLAWRQCG